MLEPSYDVLCVGILVADVFSPPLARLPHPGELMLVPNMLLSTGGCAANTAADLARLGVRTAVVGKVGNDVFADFIRQDLQAKGVDVSGLRVSATSPTSSTIILPVRGEDRRYIHAIGANAELTPSDVDLEKVRRARCLYVAGYRILPRFDPGDLSTLFRLARENQVTTCLDVAGVSAAEGLAPFIDVLPYTDVFLPNTDEARCITGEDDPVNQALRLHECGVKTVVITMGEAGVVVCRGGEVLRIGSYVVDAVDPSGAGDAFGAGFLVGLLEGWELERTLRIASAIGASACTQLGTTAGVFTRTEAETFVRQHDLVVSAMPI